MGFDDERRTGPLRNDVILYCIVNGERCRKLLGLG
jgi:hypothetical protein